MVGDEAGVEAGGLLPWPCTPSPPSLAGDELRGAVDVVGGQPDRELHLPILDQPASLSAPRVATATPVRVGI